MTNDEFQSILDSRIEQMQKVLSKKGKEYSSVDDRLHNFKLAAQILNCTPEKALIGMFVKHLVSIFDIITSLTETPVIPSEDFINEKFGDAVNYLVLLEALLKERQNT